MLRETIDMNISKTVDTVFDVKNIKSYLQVAAKFPLYDYKNQILIYKQRPDATVIAGRMAYEGSGREILPNARPIAVLYPIIKMESPGEFYIENDAPQIDAKTGVPFFKIEPKYSAFYHPEIVYDIADTVGVEYEQNTDNIHDLPSRIKYLTDFTMREGVEDEFNDVTGNGIFNPVEREFVLKSGIGEDEINRTLIGMYIDYDFYFSPVDESVVDYTDEIKRMVLYVVLTYFSLIRDDFSLIFIVKLKSEKHEVKEKILAEVQIRTAEIIQDLSDYYLSFNETAIANSVIRTDTYDYLEIQFSKAMAGIEDQDLIREMNDFKKKLYFAADGYLESLYSDVRSQKLYSFPRRKMMIDNKKYDNQS